MCVCVLLFRGQIPIHVFLYMVDHGCYNPDFTLLNQGHYQVNPFFLVVEGYIRLT